MAYKSETAKKYRTEFPRRLWLAYKKSGMTQEELADELGVTTRAVTDYLAGHYLPKAKVLRRLRRLFPELDNDQEAAA